MGALFPALLRIPKISTGYGGESGDSLRQKEFGPSISIVRGTHRPID